MEITEKAENSLKVAKLLVVSMALGLIICTVAFAWGWRRPTATRSATGYGLALALTGPTYVVAYLFLRRRLLAKARIVDATTERSEKIAPLMFIQVLTGGAMAEGFGFLGAVGYVQTGQPALLGACFFALLAMAAMFPTRNTLVRFADAARYSG